VFSQVVTHHCICFLLFLPEVEEGSNKKCNEVVNAISQNQCN
jgi:hypothetical protein